jgi:hypothetical protein
MHGGFARQRVRCRTQGGWRGFSDLSRVGLICSSAEEEERGYEKPLKCVALMLSVIKVSGVETVHCYRASALAWIFGISYLSQDQSAPHQRQRQETPNVRILFLKTPFQVLAHDVVAKRSSPCMSPNRSGILNISSTWRSTTIFSYRSLGRLKTSTRLTPFICN